ncbi:MAG: DJ-1/PfpI family protein [Alphaproteobacteria bacterium]|nr:DJ-1/PfpI family protein [Alphaproteobacteria bacterium]
MKQAANHPLTQPSSLSGTRPLTGQRIAILVANGFNEDDLTHTQRALIAAGAAPQIIGMDQGLINAWKGQGWGLHFAADSLLSTALAADFDALVIPGGARSAEKLKLTAHTRRFVGGFMDAQKPVAVFYEGVVLIAFAGKLAGLSVSAPAATQAEIMAAGATVVEDAQAQDGNLLSLCLPEAQRADMTAAVIAHMARSAELRAAA